jgi:hypothetical protein
MLGIEQRRPGRPVAIAREQPVGGRLNCGDNGAELRKQRGIVRVGIDFGLGNDIEQRRTHGAAVPGGWSSGRIGVFLRSWRRACMPGMTALRDAAEDSFGLPNVAAVKSGGSIMVCIMVYLSRSAT